MLQSSLPWPSVSSLLLHNAGLVTWRAGPVPGGALTFLLGTV